MRKTIISFACAMLAFATLSCQKESRVTSDEVTVSPSTLTKATMVAKADTLIKIVIYVETNDVNPLNAGDYYLSDGTQFADIVELFAANIHADAYGDPCLYLNDKLTPVLEYGGASTYVAPLQAKGIKVLLTVLGDWAGVGVANMSTTQADQFAAILAYAVNRYGLDGIGFDDEYANYSGSLVSNSFGYLIEKVRALLPNKIITVFQYGNYNQIYYAAGQKLDYAYTNFTYYSLNTSSSISGVTNDRWAPMSINLGNSYTSYARSKMQTNAATAANNGYGALMFFNLRQTSDVSPLPVFNAVAAGAYGESVTVSGGNRSRDAGSISAGYTITYDDI